MRYETAADAQAAMASPPIEIVHDGATLVLTPRPLLPTPFHETRLNVDYTLKLQGTGSWGVRDDEQFRTLVRGSMRRPPVDIAGIALDDLRYVHRDYPRCEDLETFHTTIWERGPGGYSLEEIAMLIPTPELLPTASECLTRQEVWLDWPADERDLHLEFEYDSIKQVVLMNGGGLGYRPK